MSNLETTRLYLKFPTLDDCESYTKNFVDYEVIRYLAATVPWPYPKDGVKTFFEQTVLPNLGKDRWMWCLFLKSNPKEAIGCVDLFREGKPENRGFWLAKKYWGQGLMTEAVIPINHYAFTYLNFEKLIFSNATGNIASRRIKEKTGAHLIDEIPFKSVDPRFTMKEIWELKREDWEKKNIQNESGVPRSLHHL